jgi:hypothetical protein
MTIRVRNVIWLATVLVLVLTACGPSDAELTPTATPVDVGMIQTQAVRAFSSQLTATALAAPTATFTSTPTSAPLVLATSGTPTLSAAATQVLCDNSAFVTDVTIPDGTVMTPGQTFTKTWKVQNSGTCTWTATYVLGFGYGNQMGGTATPIGKTVEPGQQAEISITLTAPSTAGDYTSVWRLFNDADTPFGTVLTAVIKVSGGSATATTGPTATPSPTPTETPTE